jgi:protein SCO1/2
MLRIIRYSSLALLLLVAGIWAYAWVSRVPGESVGEAFAGRLAAIFGAEMPTPAAGGVGGLVLPAGMALGGAFSLVNQAGQPVTEGDYAGRWMLVYFGFTYCPDVCPTELGTMAAALDAMGPAGEAVTPVLISIDPERDRPAQLADYVSRFHPRMQGLTGSTEQVADVARRYRVFFSRVQRPEAGEYTMDHSSFIYLVGPDGRVRTLFRPETSSEAMAASIAAQLRSAAQSPS